ncbi:MAG: hypothetical protein WDN48_00320 [Pseudolabrys sp.]
MAMTMLDKAPEKKDKAAWPTDIAAEFAREAKNPNPCVDRRCCRRTSAAASGSSASPPASASVSTAMCWIILDLGLRRQGAVSTCTTAPPSNTPTSRARRATRPTARTSSRVHDLENLGDKEMVFMTVEFKDSANKPMQLPEGVRRQAAA